MDKTLQWLYAAECDGGGISAWKSADGKWHKPYPEITGYVIPTLLAWGAADLAERCADWLIGQQNKDGSFNGLDGVPRPFDTAAIIEGLRAAFAVLAKPEYHKAEIKALKWMETQIVDEGWLKNSEKQRQPETYNLRASAIIGNVKELEYRVKAGFPNSERSHYMAYALEGAVNFGDFNFALPHIEMAYIMQSGLMPLVVNRDWTGSAGNADYCATAQMGILFQRAGLDAGKQYEILKDRLLPNGGLEQGSQDSRQISWAAKYWLDFKYYMEAGDG